MGNHTHTHVHYHGEQSSKLDAILTHIARIETTLQSMSTKESTMSKELEDLTAQVKSNSDLLDSATTLINGIAARVDNAVQQAQAAGADPSTLTALTALSGELKAKDDELAAAIQANTPAADTGTGGAAA